MKSRKRFAMNIVIAGAVLLQVGGAIRAQGWDSCSARVRQDGREVRQAIDRYGFDSQQAQYERAELQRDAQNCGYSYSARAYSDGDRDDQSYGRYNPSFENGYRDGVIMGKSDSRKGRSFRPENNDQYEDADRGYNRSYGDKNLYKNQYRRAFERGYTDGYGSWR